MKFKEWFNRNYEYIGMRDWDRMESAWGAPREISEREEKHIAKIIQKEIPFLNEWASEEEEKSTCKLAAKKVVKYLGRDKS